jgi:hypothetical protein
MRKQTSFVLTSSLFALALALPAGARAEEEHRELGAHVHGHGSLSIAIEETRLSMELEVPGMDIVGFEHAASTDEQTAKVEAAKALLQKPLGLFVLPAAAGCSVSAADVALEAEHDHGDDHDAKEEKADGHDHDHDAHDHDGHNQFHATYEFNCTSPADLTSIGFDYFKQFGGAQGLTVNVVTAKGQSKYEVGRDKPTLDLGGIM